MAVNKYWVGTKILLYADFKNELGVSTDVDLAILNVKHPTGKKETFSPSQSYNAQALPIVGRYEYLFEIKSVGTYAYWFTATLGVNKIVEQKTFISLAVE